jgi:hypothetical protein
LKHLSAATIACTYLLSTHLVQAAQADDQTARVVRAEMDKQHIPGLAPLVSRKGVPIRAQGFGLANVELTETMRASPPAASAWRFEQIHGKAP